MRYVSLAYGTRAEIEEVFRHGASGTRSERRQEQAQRALAELLAGENAIEYGQTIYMIEEPASQVTDS